MVSKSNHVTQRNQIFGLINFMGTPCLFFTLNLAVIHHPLLAILSGQNINLDFFYDKNMLTKNEQCKYATINPKAQAIFVNTNCQHYIQIYVTSKKHKKFIYQQFWCYWSHKSSLWML